MNGRIFLSPPHMGGEEQAFLAEAFASNYVAPCGPMVDAFEREFAERVGAGAAVALASGTAALHLAMIHLGVGPGDRVYCPTLTFIASIAPAIHLGATPVFLDVDPATWTLDPGLLEQTLAADARAGRLPRLVVSVDLYGQCCDMDRLAAICARHGVPLLSDSAEALGATWRGRPAGKGAAAAVFSFNGNKILTTSGGGMLVSDDPATVARARHLATQARLPAAHYEHAEAGYNYRMSNLLAAVGRGQLRVLDGRVAAKRRIFDGYVRRLSGLPGLSFMPEAPGGRASRWLTVIQLDPQAAHGVVPEDLRLALEAEDIESRPVWKPMHLQPVFADAEVHGGGAAERLFRNGLCLPSGTALSEGDLDRIAGILRATLSSTP
ncbi:MAG: DegT/DnrJ/EryC1/StrS family aminotransferase [Kiritimatiellia bacterium]|jgi:dTDP-4-amino-4,6-dideoxygalactose transaminase